MELSIGIDWADQSHTICLRERGTRRIVAEFEITHTAAGVNRLEETIQALGCTPDRCVVAIETNQGMLVNYLFESGYRVHPIPPAAVKAIATDTGVRARNQMRMTRSSSQIFCARTWSCFPH